MASLIGGLDGKDWVYGQFPANREKSREFRVSRRFLPKYLAASPADEVGFVQFRRICRLSAKSVSKITVTPLVCEEIPYAAAQGIFSCPQGIISAFSTAAGKMA